MTMKNLYLVLNIIFLYLLVGCGLAAPSQESLSAAFTVTPSREPLSATFTLTPSQEPLSATFTAAPPQEPLSAAFTVTPSQEPLLSATFTAAPPQEPLSATFTQPTYHLGDNLEFSVELVNQGATPKTMTLNLVLEGTHNTMLPFATFIELPFQIWSESQVVTLQVDEKRNLTYEIPHAIYEIVGMGFYKLQVGAPGLKAAAETVVLSVFDVEVTYPDRLQTGQMFTVQAVVTNMADFDVHDVEVKVNPADTPDHVIDRLPAHTSKTVLWMVTVPDYLRDFDPFVFVMSSDGGNLMVFTPSVPITPGSTP